MGKQLSLFKEKACESKPSLYLTEERIAKLVKKCADKINMIEGTPDKPILLIALLNGAVPFATDLMRKLDLPLEVRYAKASFYGSAKTATEKELGHVLELEDVVNRSVLLVDELCDSGVTLDKVYERLSNNGALTIHTVTLLQRKGSRFTPDIVGHVADTKDWFYGYGMDSEGMNRNLPNIYTESPC